MEGEYRLASSSSAAAVGKEESAAKGSAVGRRVGDDFDVAISNSENVLQLGLPQSGLVWTAVITLAALSHFDESKHYRGEELMTCLCKQPKLSTDFNINLVKMPENAVE